MANLFDDVQTEISNRKTLPKFNGFLNAQVMNLVANKLRRLAEEQANAEEPVPKLDDPKRVELIEARTQRIKAAGAAAFKVELTDTDLVFAVTGLTPWASDLLAKADDCVGKGKSKTKTVTFTKEA